jgi:anti-sigma factor RsiW
MSGERFQSRPQVGETSGARADDGRFGGCLTDVALQSIADGTLRGPERMLAEQHIEECPRCSAELAIYSGLMLKLNSLCDPPLPLDFTAGVMQAVQLREQVRDEKHRALLAALPAALIAVGVLLAWAFSGNVGQRVRDLVVGATVVERVAEATLSVLQAVRVPVALSSLLVLACLLLVLSRALGKMRHAAVAARS